MTRLNSHTCPRKRPDRGTKLTVFLSRFFKIGSRFRREGVLVYTILDWDGDRVKGKFYEPKLQPVNRKPRRKETTEILMKQIKIFPFGLVSKRKGHCRLVMKVAKPLLESITMILYATLEWEEERIRGCE